MPPKLHPQKKGRKPKDYKPPFCQSLQVKKKDIIISFDKNAKGDLKDFLKPKDKSNQKKH